MTIFVFTTLKSIQIFNLLFKSFFNCTNIRPIVIYIKFSDDTTPYFTNDMLNEIKNGLSGSSGYSLSNYVNWISYGKCSIDPIFTYDKNKIIYTPAHPSSYYKKYKAGINEQGYKTDDEKNARKNELFNGAFKACTKNIDFSNVDLDRNGDGNIDSIFFFNSSYDDYAEILYSEKWAIWSEQPEIVDKSGKKKKVYDYINNRIDDEVIVKYPGVSEYVFTSYEQTKPTEVNC